MLNVLNGTELYTLKQQKIICYLNFILIFKKRQARLQNANHHLQCPSSPFPCIPCPTPKHKPPPMAVHKLLIEKGSLPTSPFATMVEPDWPLMDNKMAQPPRTLHVPLHTMIRANCLCFSSALGPTQIILRED